jgi:EAL domain-containing protein (putative c-di-GMP-specific phosphodiesterase class I)
VQNIELTMQVLRELRRQGVSIAIDDFGTGQSSLMYLKQFPIDTIKIDRAFVRAMSEHHTDVSIITTIVSLAQALKLHVVAEGVETQPQADRLLALGCDQAQGYLFSPPVCGERIEQMLS